MDSVETPQGLDPKTFDAIDAAAYTLGSPALGVYLYLELKRQAEKRRSFLCAEVREILKIKEHRTFKKYLEMIHDARLATVIFTARGDSFLFEKVFLPVPVGKVAEVAARDFSHPEENFPSSVQSLSPGQEKNPPGTAKDVGGVLELKHQHQQTPCEFPELEEILKLASLRPIGGHQVKLFLGTPLLEAALKYDCTLTIPGHLLHAWQDSIKYDGKDLVQAVQRVKNAVLYVLQQREMGIPIKNRVGYFFDAVRRGRTPSVKPERKAVLEKVRPQERTPEEVHQDKVKYWETRSFEDLKNEWELLEKMNLDRGSTSSKIFLEGVSLSPSGSEFGSWLKTRRGA